MQTEEWSFRAFLLKFREISRGKFRSALVEKGGTSEYNISCDKHICLSIRSDRSGRGCVFHFPFLLNRAGRKLWILRVRFYPFIKPPFLLLRRGRYFSAKSLLKKQGRWGIIVVQS